MTLTEYQNTTHETAIYRNEDRYDYLPAQLLSEVGELLSLIAKSIRDRVPMDREKLCLELGDIYWCLSEVANETGSQFMDVWELQIGFRELSDSELGQYMMEKATEVNKHLRTFNRLHIPYTEWTYYPLQSLVQGIATFGSRYGLTCEEIRLKNREKLLYRQARKTLTGSGDNR